MLILQSKSTQQQIELNQARITVGRDKSNIFVLSDSDVSGFHAEFHYENDQVSLVDLGSSNGTFINGNPISGKVKIKAWDKIKFASIEFEVVDPSGRRPTQMTSAITEADLANAAKAGLGKSSVADTVAMPSTGGQFKLIGAKGTLAITSRHTIGRDDGCDLVIAEQSISRNHAVISVSNQSVKIEDSGSANGTFVNGQKITSTQLKVGDKVKFDTVEFTLDGPVDNNKTQVRAAIDPNKTQTRAAVDLNETQTRPAVGANKTAVMKTPSSTLKVVAGAAPKSITLDKSRYTIGRADANDVSLSTDSVSGQHAVLEKVGSDWKLTDQGSTNGTFVNGKKTNLAVLSPGDKVKFGEVECVFEGVTAATSNHTRAMPNATVAMSSVQKKSLPAWVYGVGGFLLVAIVMGFVLFKDEVAPIIPGGKPAQIAAKLQAGKTWSISLPEHRNVTGTPALGDINNDGYLDVIVADQKGYVTALDGQEGKEIYTSDLAGQIVASVALADVTGDDNLDVIVATDSGVVRALDSRGQTLWTSDANLNMGGIINKPAIVDVDDDGVADVIVPSKNRGLVALNGNRGWEIWNTAETTQGQVVTSPLVADLNNDGVVDIVSVTNKGQVVAFSAQNGKAWQLWEANAPKVGYASPVVYQDNGLNLVIVTSESNGVTAFDAISGRASWTVLDGARIFSTPIVSDINGDDIGEIIVTTESGDIYALNAQFGEEVNSGKLSGKYMATHAKYDVSDDDIAELVMVDRNGNLHVTETNRMRSSLTINLPGSKNVVASPLLGDINNDGMLDVVVASGNGTVSAYSFNRTVREGDVVSGEFLGRSGE